jgi:integrase
MQRSKSVLLNQSPKQAGAWPYGWTSEQNAGHSTDHYWSSSTTITSQIQSIETPKIEAIESICESRLDASPGSVTLNMTLAEFVENAFVPEHVAKKTSAGRAYFQGILKHVLTPERVDRAFRAEGKGSRIRHKAIPGWPYLDAMRLRDVRPDHIQQIVFAALSRGYSTQTATHIRNVVRVIFSHVEKTMRLPADNPADDVRLPGIVRREAHVLTIEQLRRLIGVMRYPEREVAIFAILTEMSVAEICGLQWKHLNLSEHSCKVDGEWIPARTIAVRKQSYRCEFGPVLNCRERDIPVPDLLASILRKIRNRRIFSAREDFVVASRSGTPINQDNVASRRLKSIGRRLEMPWLSWYVFHRTNVALSAELGPQLHCELENALPAELTLTRRSRSATGTITPKCSI